MTKRLSGLDGIRAISITLVLVFHLTASAGLRPWEAGAFGVDIFFVLSGFLITWLICGEEAETATISLRAFYTRRALRILPPAITYLAALVILARFGWGSISLSDITHCLLFVRNLFGGAVTTAHYWTLSVEEQFYLLWPIAMVLLRTNRTRLKIASLLVLAAPFWRFVNYHWLGTAATINGARFDLRYDAILIGCCLALLRNDPSLGKYLQQGILQSRW